METLPDDIPVTVEGYREIHRYIFQDVFFSCWDDRPVMTFIWSGSTHRLGTKPPARAFARAIRGHCAK
jgi:hypothetical protein